MLIPRAKTRMLNTLFIVLTVWCLSDTANAASSELSGLVQLSPKPDGTGLFNQYEFLAPLGPGMSFLPEHFDNLNVERTYLGGGGSSAVASASVDPARRLFKFQTYSEILPATYNTNSENDGPLAIAQARAEIKDTFTIHSFFGGPVLEIVFKKPFFDGDLIVSTPPGFTHSQAAYTYTQQVGGHEYGFSDIVNWSGGTQTNHPDSHGSNIFFVPSNVPISFVLNFEFSSGVDVDGPLDEILGARASFAHTVSWGGIEMIKNADTGEIITDWSLTSDSGVLWDVASPTVAAVPEPSEFMLLALGLGVIGKIFRRRCARTQSIGSEQNRGQLSTHI